MRVGFYHESAGTGRAGGISVYIRHLAAALADSHEVVCYTIAGECADDLRDGGVRVVDLPVGWDSLHSMIQRLPALGPQEAQKLAVGLAGARGDLFDRMGEDLDVLVTCQYLDDLVVSRAVDVPTVFGYHRFDNVGLGIRARERLSTTETVFANSSHTAQLIEEHFGYEVDAIVPPGVDTDLFSPDQHSPIDGEDNAVVFAGRFVPAKGLEELVEALARLEEPAHLYVLGQGDERYVERLVDRAGVADAVTIVGEVPQSTLAGYLAGADLFCLPSHTESFGQANLEALASATPVVTTTLPAIREYVTDGETGVLVPPRSPRTLAQAMDDLLADPARRERMGRRGRTVAREWSWDAQAERFSSVLESTCRQESQSLNNPKAL